jgi:hypothetical protein
MLMFCWLFADSIVKFFLHEKILGKRVRGKRGTSETTSVRREKVVEPLPKPKCKRRT